MRYVFMSNNIVICKKEIILFILTIVISPTSALDVVDQYKISHYFRSSHRRKNMFFHVILDADFLFFSFFVLHNFLGLQTGLFFHKLQIMKNKMFHYEVTRYMIQIVLKISLVAVRKLVLTVYPITFGHCLNLCLRDERMN